MSRTMTLALAAASLAVLSSLTGPAAADPPDSTTGDARVCADVAVGYAHCDAHVRTKGGRPDATVGRNGGYIGSQLRTAYGLTTDSTATVAIIDAYRNPNAASDLAIYRADTGVAALTGGQFVDYNQNGIQGSYAAADVGWGQEEMLDLEMVSAICPSCKIMYVGANSASFADLGTAVNTAARLGAKVVSNSYGGGEYAGELTVQTSYYDHAGIAITVSSGDSGYGVQIPAAFKTVTAVGGTSLTLNANNTRANETVWSGAGSGCSAYIDKPTWQRDTGCSRRTVADVSAVADPNTGVAVYDSYGSTANANWYVFGGTSVAAPIIGTVYALSGNTAGYPASVSYAPPVGSLFDVTSGSNGRCTTRKNTAAAYLCTGVAGYDGPTGNGTPNGTGAF